MYHKSHSANAIQTGVLREADYLVINRSIHKDVQGLRKPSPGGCGENSQLSLPLARGSSREWKKADGKLQNSPAESHRFRRCASLPDLSLIGTTCGIHGLCGDGRFHPIPANDYFLFKGFRNAAFPSSRGRVPCCQACFYGLSPKQV